MENCLIFIFFYLKYLLKKIWNCFEFVLIASFIILLMYTPFNHPIENYFLPNLAPIFFITFIYFHLRALIFICKNFFLFMIVSENLFLFIIIYESLFFFARIFSYLRSFVRMSSFLWESFWTLLICENLFLFMIICENLLAHFLIFTVFMKISKRMNAII